MVATMAGEETEKSFAHSGCDSQFQVRNDAIFSSLANLEKKHEEEVPKDDPFAEDTRTQSGGQHRPRRPSRVPDHVLHPDKWREYSLKEDGSENYQGLQGDNLNTSIATNFLQELAERKQGKREREKEVIPAESKADEKISFQKPVESKRKREESDGENEEDFQAPNQGSSNFVRMKTFEFGQKKEKVINKKSLSTTETAGDKQLSLAHLEEVDEEETTSEQATDADRKQQEKSKFDQHRKIRKNLRKAHAEEES